MEGYVLDSFAVLTYLYGQEGSDKVERLLMSLEKKGSPQAWLNLINLDEIYYIIARNEDFDKADKAVALVKQWPIEVIQPTEKLTLSAGRIKASYPLSYADAFVVATALERRATVLTGDPEFKKLEKIIKIEWI